ncbi:MAG TPA: response regulator [Deltaproteobacteria bacterium]|nr:response regulator [Deltaproteobacteria bacterium]HQJ07652.1 response regulator [Deltaproteobacteria bacterium]
MGKARILVMDDEEIIQDVLSSMLDFLGYEAEVASDGEKAVAMYRSSLESQKPFDALIMDLTIHGGMGGKEAIKELVKIDPNVKAIVSSGYSTDPAVTNFREYGFKAVISKPFKIEELGDILKQVIG